MIPIRTLVSRALPRRARALARRIVRPARLSASEYEMRYHLNQLQSFEGILNRHDRSFGDFSSILDFACGRGRLTQYMPWLAPKAQIFGCDIDEESLVECRRLYSWGHFLANRALPPLDFDDGKFDLIWSYSVFTSLSESCHVSWLEELGKKLRSGGVMLHTTHSFECLRRAATFSPKALDKYEFPEPVEKIIKANQGYYYVPYSPETPDYGLAIISRDYVESKWPDYSGLSLLDYAEGAIEAWPEGCQDMVLMVKE